MRYSIFNNMKNRSKTCKNALFSYAKQPSITQIRDRYDQILTSDIHKKILPYLHYTQQQLFQKIFEQLLELSTKVKLSNIDLIDLVLLINERMLIQFVFEMEKSSLNRNTLDKIVLCDNTYALELLEEKGLIVDIRLMRFAAENGSLACLKYCAAKGLAPDINALNDAALNGHIHVIKYLVQERNIIPDIATLDWAIIGAHSTPYKTNEACYFLSKIVLSASNKENSHPNIRN